MLVLMPVTSKVSGARLAKFACRPLVPSFQLLSGPAIQLALSNPVHVNEPASGTALTVTDGALVGSQTPAVSARFTAELVERARRQRAVAVPMRALGGLVAAIAAALAGAVGSGRGPGRP